jgi:Cytochrome c7 and related cytochrome c
MKIIRLLGLVGIAALLSISTLIAGKSAPKFDNSKLIKFSHSKHINDVGAACTDCHTTVTTSTNTTDYLLPTMATCYSCHDQSSTKCEFCHTSADSTTYQDLVQAPSPVHFSHERHAGTLKLKCETCHQGLDKVDYSKNAPNEGLPLMEQCTVCHGQGETNFTAKKVDHPITAAPGACETCHKDLTDLVPQSHEQVNWMKEHKNFVNMSGPQNDCKSCHTPATCQECHDASNMAKDLGPGQLYVPSTPSLSPMTTHKNLTIQKVHPDNFRFTHSIEAKGRESTCYTCHDERNFCVQCHNSEANGALIKPVWHDGGGFVTNGVGSGGGRHAQYARKDIESCASCHDVQGGDPVCITCHTDPDGVKGDDPRTHTAMFMHDTHGSWHTDPGAVCYTCHTDPNAHPGGRPGIGFCGYCHGSNPGD